MKIAVIADIHANLPALEAVLEDLDAWEPDRVFVAGDMVNRGPRPKECLRLIQKGQEEEDWFVIQGNHEEYVLDRDQPDDPREGPYFDWVYYSYWTYQALGEDVAFVKELPHRITEDLGQRGSLFLLHASSLSNRGGIYPETKDEDLPHLIHPSPTIMAVGHTHRAFVRTFRDTLIVNAGSVGLPFDGDTRAGYARITWRKGRWQGEIVRIPYDLKRAVRDFDETGFGEDAGPVTELILLELRTAIPQLYQWTLRYRKAVLAGELGVMEAARAFLKDPVTEPYWGVIS